MLRKVADGHDLLLDRSDQIVRGKRGVRLEAAWRETLVVNSCHSCGIVGTSGCEPACIWHRICDDEVIVSPTTMSAELRLLPEGLGSENSLREIRAVNVSDPVEVRNAITPKTIRLV